MEGKGGNMVVKVFKDVLILTVLFIAMSKIGNTKEPIDQGGVKLRNCLLYTSPSPRDVEESRMPSSA